MTLKTIVNRVQSAVGLPQSSTVIGSTDSNVRRLLELANIEGEELAKRHAWKALTKEHTITATATETQTDGVPSDLDRFIPETFFNRTQKRRLVGPMSSEEWQYQKGLTSQILTDAFRVRGGNFLILPTPEAGDVYAYEYVSKNWCQNTGMEEQEEWTADTDTGLLDEVLMRRGLVWRWKAANGLDYAEDFNSYEVQVAQAIMREGSRRTINFGVDESLIDNARIPTLPEGSWQL